MKKTQLRLAAVAMSLAAAIAMPAGAAPARSATLNADNLKYEWGHGPVLIATGYDYVGQLRAMCEDPGFPCDDTLFQLTHEGKLKLVATATEDLPGGQNFRPDVDIYLYKSDANGTVGPQVGAGETPSASETIQINKAAPGYYLLRVAYWSGINTSYTGTATFTPPPPPAPAP
jgi:hypothetical protein